MVVIVKRLHARIPSGDLDMMSKLWSNVTYCVEQSDKDFLCYLIESVGLRKCPHGY